MNTTGLLAVLRRRTARVVVAALVILSILVFTVCLIQGCGKRMRTVGIDLQHGEDWPGLAETLATNGFRVVPIKHPLDTATLKKIGVLMIFAPTKPYADAEVQSIARFVKAGGGLLCAGQAWSWTYKEYGNRPIETHPLNVLGQQLNFTVTSENAGTPTYLETEIMTGIERVERTDWWPSKVETTSTNGQTVVQDQNRSSLGERFTVGKGRIVVYGHDSLLKDNPKVLLKTVSYLKDRSSTNSTLRESSPPRDTATALDYKTVEFQTDQRQQMSEWQREGWLVLNTSGAITQKDGTITRKASLKRAKQ
jgi:hypothetical protein